MQQVGPSKNRVLVPSLLKECTTSGWWWYETLYTHCTKQLFRKEDFNGLFGVLILYCKLVGANYPKVSMPKESKC